MSHPRNSAVSTLARRFVGRFALLATLLAAGASAVAAPAEKEQKFLRFVETEAGAQLQTSVVHYQNDAGVKVDLIGAVHIGDAAYFDALNGRFKDYDALLYEMVKPKGSTEKDIKRGTRKSAGKDSGKSMSWVSFLQHTMKDQLELDFQLERIDYEAPNFVHADLDVETFFQKQEERGESMLTLMFDSMMRELSKSPDEHAADAGKQMGIMDLIQALQAPDRGRQLKLVLGRQFSDLDDALSAMGGKEGSVILDERNKHALEVLKQQIDAGKKNLGIFYGAGHMKGMEETMTKLMGFKQVGEPEWLVAWDIPAKPKGQAKPMVPATQPSTRPAAAMAH